MINSWFFINPSEKYAREIGFIFPNLGGSHEEDGKHEPECLHVKLKWTGHDHITVHLSAIFVCAAMTDTSLQHLSQTLLSDASLQHLVATLLYNTSLQLSSPTLFYIAF